MRTFMSLVTIGLVSGCILALFLVLIFVTTGNQAYILLFNVDYIPVLRYVWSQPGIGIVFHFVFCIISVVGLFYFLSLFHLEHWVLPYVAVYTVGSAVLFFLTTLSDRPPAIEFISWFYWTCAHILFGLSVGFFVKRLDFCIRNLDNFGDS